MLILLKRAVACCLTTFVKERCLLDVRDCLFGTLLLLLLLLLLLFTAIDFSLGGSSPYTSTNKTNKNKYT
jgi:hypothetical protein